MSGRRRLDSEMLRRGLVESREQAQAAIADRQVLVAGTVADKASRLVSPSDPVVVAGPPPRFVSRGGYKLEAALDRFRLDVGGCRALDAGASTGGFTDCLLQRGAASVTAVDVGRGQLHPRLASDPRVRRLDRTNIRNLTLDTAGGEPFDIVVADLSFISLRTVAPVLLGPLSRADASAVILVKPQFEAGRVAASKGRGVIRDPAVWSLALLQVLGAVADQQAAMIGLMVSPLTGADGNVEFLAHFIAHRTPDGNASAKMVAAVASVVADAVGRRGMVGE